ncbi:NNMT methyltransferase, partial [Amia calva]|nr:NNMT methyltransferase [Amia calva]
MAFTEGEHYHSHFNPRVYIDSFYVCPSGHPDENCLSFVLRNLSETFSSGRYKGQTLIEVGSGPTVHSVVSACDHFQDIVLSDFTETNRLEVQKWLRGDEGCFDWSPVIQFVSELEGKRTPKEMEERLRRTVKQVLPCDVRHENPFHPLVLEPADCVLTSLCLEAACKDHPTYQQALKNVTALLRPGGVLIMIGVLNETFYVVGEHRLSCLPLSQTFVENALKDLGFSIQKNDILPMPDRDKNKVSDCEAFFFLIAEKMKNV